VVIGNIGFLLCYRLCIDNSAYKSNLEMSICFVAFVTRQRM